MITETPILYTERLCCFLVVNSPSASFHGEQLHSGCDFQIFFSNRTEELECANLRFKQLSETDPLTKIPNRRAYDERICAEIEAAKRSKQSLSLLLVDIDYFKAYNDQYGHGAGDMALRRVAEEIIEVLPRSTDFAARLGGEEFVGLLPLTDAQGACHVAQRICSHVKSLKIRHDSSHGIGVITVSIGVASMSGVSISEAKLLQQADQALYEAKHAGRNRCVIFDSTANQKDT